MLKQELIRPYSSELRILVRLFDISTIFLSMLFAVWIRKIELSDEYIIGSALTILLFSLVSSYQNLYRSWRIQNITDEIRKIITIWVISIGILLFLGFVIKATIQFSRIAFGIWILLALFTMIGWRIFVRLTLKYIRKKGRNIRIVTLAGAGVLGKRFAEKILNNPSMGLHIYGFYDDKKDDDSVYIGDRAFPILGNLDAMILDAKGKHFDTVYFTLPMKAEQRIKETVDGLADTSVSVYLIPNFFVFDLIQSQWINVDGIPLLSIFESPFLGTMGWLKRAQDILISATLLILLSIPMIIIACLIKITSRGPVIFKQRRYGMDGKEICVYKYRTMSVMEDGDNVPQAKKNDKRITSLGRLLRKTSLDELPQFINVLQNRMSIVGPRPHAIAHNQQYLGLISGYMRRHKVKPGITGWAQVNGWRGETDVLEKMEKRVEFDMEYIKNWSLWMDIKIILLTILRGVWSKQAY